MYRHPDLDAYDAVHSVPVAVTLRLRDGRELVRRVDTARGYPENPLSDEELLAKFKECAGLALPRRRAEDLAEAVLRLDELADVNQLTELLRA
jgi:2-methylcitrate dehydratase PrpD